MVFAQEVGTCIGVNSEEVVVKALCYKITAVSRHYQLRNHRPSVLLHAETGEQLD
jgi:hypothetical protein